MVLYLTELIFVANFSSAPRAPLVENQGKSLLRNLCSFFFFKLYLFIYYFWLQYVSVAAHGLSLDAASGGYSPVAARGLPILGLLLWWGMASTAPRLSSCGTRV